jgi:hypothetical protein
MDELRELFESDEENVYDVLFSEGNGEYNDYLELLEGEDLSESDEFLADLMLETEESVTDVLTEGITEEQADIIRCDLIPMTEEVYEFLTDAYYLTLEEGNEEIWEAAIDGLLEGLNEYYLEEGRMGAVKNFALRQGGRVKDWGKAGLSKIVQAGKWVGKKIRSAKDNTRDYISGALAKRRALKNLDKAGMTDAQYKAARKEIKGVSNLRRGRQQRWDRAQEIFDKQEKAREAERKARKRSFFPSLRRRKK